MILNLNLRFVARCDDVNTLFIISKFSFLNIAKFCEFVVAKVLKVYFI